MGNKPAGKETKKYVSTRTVTELDAKRYAGEWHEIASYQNSYRSDCEKSLAFYVYEESDPEIEVYKLTNYCFKNGVVVDSITGTARIPNMEEPGRIKVKFDGINFKPEGDYWIYETDYDNYSLVGDGKGEAFWILSRRETISSAEWVKLMRKVHNLGYLSKYLNIAENAVDWDKK